MVSRAIAALCLLGLAAGPVPRRVDPLTGVAFARIPAGTFEMGTRVAPPD